MYRPKGSEEAAILIRDQTSLGRRIRPLGGGTKASWGAQSNDEASAQSQIDVTTTGLNRIVAHNVGDFTAVLEAGVPLASAQAVFAQQGQMLALDSPLGADDAATIGGILATNDSGPLRHRYGGIRELVLGATVVLSDGTVATSGSTVIKNVAGYDLAKLFTGSFGTLGLVVRMAVRLHPTPATTATVVGESADPDRLLRAVMHLCRLPIEAESLDVRWQRGIGQILVRFAGAAAKPRASAAARYLDGLESVRAVDDDAALWAQQRSMQRTTATGTCVLKVSGRPTDLPLVLRTADACRGTVVSRAALGLSWMVVPASEVNVVRRALAPRACMVLDGAGLVPDPWPIIEPGTLAVMKRIKARFDPHATFRPGTFAGGI